MANVAAAEALLDATSTASGTCAHSGRED